MSSSTPFLLLVQRHFLCTTLQLYGRELGRLEKDTVSLETAEHKNSILGDVLVYLILTGYVRS